MVRRGGEVQLRSPTFEFTLDTKDGLRARAWRNELTGRRISLGLGPEVELDFDSAERRIWITGWKEEGEHRTTHVFLPLEAKGKKLLLTLGGFGLYDYREIDVTLNGQAVGSRHALKRWNEPGCFPLGPGAPISPFLRFGQDNVLEIRCREPILRTERMEKLGVHLDLPIKQAWPAQFEQYLTVGTPLSTPRLTVTKVEDRSRAGQGEVRVELESVKRDVRVAVTYRWDAKAPLLHKFVEVQNLASQERRLMNVRLGDYATDVTVSEGEQGFPVYLEDECFMSVAHPSGWAIGQEGHVTLRQYPGKLLAPAGRFDCMEVVLGAAKTGEARQSFVDHIRSRCRRVVRAHDKPYSIYETFGGAPGEQDFMLKEKYVVEMIDKLGQGKGDAGYHFDLISTEFWADSHGDLEHADPKRFPNGFTNINAKLEKLGIAPGLWIDSSWGDWSIGGNPVVRPAFTHDSAYNPEGLYGSKTLCRATDPIRTMYSTAFRHHIRENGVRLFKFDNLYAICYNPNHPHMPGVYSTEAIQSAVIETLRNLDAESADVFLMLYWGYRSPWWLLWGDTIFESGLQMEAASPGELPTFYMRDGVAVRVDQGQRWREDVPAIGKDTLGIWLSDWSWNSRIGKERWQQGFVMDICRGHLLAQIWTDYPWLSPPERRELAEFIALLKAAPGCFANARPVLGNPWKNEPYGYACSDGQQAFVALNNCTWSDVSIPLELNVKWGLPDQGRWDVYRWYPDPAKLAEKTGAWGRNANIALRPFEVVLLQVLPIGQPPALDRRFETQPMPAHFAEASAPIEVAAVKDEDSTAAAPWVVLNPTSSKAASGATLTIKPDHSLLASGRNATPETYTATANTDLTGITAIRLEALPDATLPGGGPGRAVNGNFALNEFRVSVAPQNDPSQTQQVALEKATADFSQPEHGNWPVAAAIDGDPQTGWSIDPEEGSPHTAVFATKEPVGFPGGTVLTFVLHQQNPKNHNLGRFRLSVTTANPPPVVKTGGPARWVLTGQVPTCPRGGTLVVSAELSLDGSPFLFRDAGARFTCRSRVDRQDVHSEPVLRGPGWSTVSWQAWRIALKPSATPQTFALQIAAKAPETAEFSFKGHFIPLAQ
jgi:hypothetical protein